MAGRGASLETQVKQMAAEIRSLHSELSRITEQREATDAMNAEKQKDYDNLAAKHKEIAHKLRCGCVLVAAAVAAPPPDPPAAGSRTKSTASWRRS